MKKKGNTGRVCDLLFTSPIKQMVEGLFFFSQGTIKFTSDHSNNSKANPQLSHYNNDNKTRWCKNLPANFQRFLPQLAQKLRSLHVAPVITGPCDNVRHTAAAAHTPALHLIEHNP